MSRSAEQRTSKACPRHPKYIAAMYKVEKSQIYEPLGHNIVQIFLVDKRAFFDIVMLYFVQG